MTNLKRVEFLAPEKMLKEFDAAWPKLGFDDRTQALRHSMRNIIAKAAKGVQ